MSDSFTPFSFSAPDQGDHFIICGKPLQILVAKFFVEFTVKSS